MTSEEVLEAALDLLLKKKDPLVKAERAAKKEEEVSHQEDDGDHDDSNQKSNSDSRYIPKRIRHKVYLRDGGRCTFVDHVLSQ